MSCLSTAAVLLTWTPLATTSSPSGLTTPSRRTIAYASPGPTRTPSPPQILTISYPHLAKRTSTSSPKAVTNVSGRFLVPLCAATPPSWVRSTARPSLFGHPTPSALPWWATFADGTHPNTPCAPSEVLGSGNCSFRTSVTATCTSTPSRHVKVTAVTRPTHWLSFRRLHRARVRWSLPPSTHGRTVSGWSVEKRSTTSTHPSACMRCTLGPGSRD